MSKEDYEKKHITRNDMLTLIFARVLRHRTELYIVCVSNQVALSFRRSSVLAG